jgi:hypothetical protein
VFYPFDGLCFVFILSPYWHLIEHHNSFEISISCKCVIPTKCYVYFKVLRINSDNISYAWVVGHFVHLLMRTSNGSDSRRRRLATFEEVMKK